MPMLGTSLSEPHPTIGAEPWAVVGAPRRERECKHQGVAKGRLKIEQVPVQRVPVLVPIPAVLLITEQFLAPDVERLCHRLQAPGALSGQRRRGRDRRQHTLGHRLQQDFEINVGALWNPRHASAKVGRGGNDPGFGTR
jgi:hypothetical protein